MSLILTRLSCDRIRIFFIQYFSSFPFFFFSGSCDGDTDDCPSGTPTTEAHAEIDGGPEKYVKSGSTLKLTCHLRQSSVTPDFVFWYQDERMINYEGAAGVKVISDAASSTLIIERAQSVHSGNYSCVPYNVNPSSVIVHILNGKLQPTDDAGLVGRARTPSSPFA